MLKIWRALPRYILKTNKQTEGSQPTCISDIEVSQKTKILSYDLGTIVLRNVPLCKLHSLHTPFFYSSYCLLRLYHLTDLAEDIWMLPVHYKAQNKAWAPGFLQRVAFKGVGELPHPWLGSISEVIKIGPTYATPHWLQWLKRHLRSRTQQTTRPH